jgi:hypothetical protein
MPICPNCDSLKIVNTVGDAEETSASPTVKNGCIHNGKQRFKCKECSHQFIKNLQKIIINQEKRDLIDRLLLERICAVR